MRGSIYETRIIHVWEDVEQWGLEGHSWRTRGISLPMLAWCTDMSGKTSTRCCTHPTTPSGTNIVSSWRFLWSHHICKVRVCEELHETAVSEEAAMYDTHNFSRITAFSPLPPPKFQMNFFTSANYDMLTLSAKGKHRVQSFSSWVIFSFGILYKFTLAT